jgi:glycosyltransferase involved in cell wall biosynthesis
VATEPDIDIGVFGLMSSARNYEAMLELHAWMEARPQLFPGRPRWAFVGKAPPPAITVLRSPRVEVTGYVPDLRPHYARTQIVVVPSRFGTGVKTTVLEAWAMGRPVVATPFALQGLPARPGENVLVGDSPEALARCVAELLAAPALRERLGAAGCRTVRSERDIRVLAVQFADVCARALDETPRGASQVAS